MTFSFKEISFLAGAKSLLTVLMFLYLLDIPCLTNLIWYCLFVVEFLKSFLETGSWRNFGMILFLRQVSKKPISYNTSLYLKSNFSNSLTFLIMTSSYLFHKSLIVDKCLGKQRRTKNKRLMYTGFTNIF